MKFIKLLEQLNKSGKIPAKECRACGKVYCDLYQYIWDTEAKAQTMEDAGGVMDKAFTMLYRNCSCGNTLVLTLTGDTFPEITDFWNAMRLQAESGHESLKEVVTSFMSDWEAYIIKNTPCKRTIRHRS